MRTVRQLQDAFSDEDLMLVSRCIDLVLAREDVKDEFTKAEQEALQVIQDNLDEAFLLRLEGES